MKLLLTFLLALCSLAHAQTYYVPPGVTTIRAMIVGGTPLQGGTPQYWRDYCAAQRVGLAQTLGDLPAIATASGHPEIANAPIVTIGTSAGASAAAAVAIANPTRAVAVVGLHGVMFALGNDDFNANRSGEEGSVPTLNFSGVYGVPMIHNFDNNDGFVNPVVLQSLVEWGRARGAPWTFFIHNDGNHTDNEVALNTLIFPWLTSVLDLRVPTSGAAADGTVTLNAIVESNGWLGNIKTGVSSSFASYPGDRTKADWFPNQAVATIWSGYHFLPTYNIPAQPIVAPTGIVADLTILDPINNDTTSGTGWKINANLKEADQAGSLVKYFLLAPPPASVAGLDWIRPITPGNHYVAYTADPIFTFRVTADATLFIAHSDQVAPRPAWLSSWTNTGEFLVVTGGNLTSTAPHYTLFKKDFTANSTVTCGANGTVFPGQMYLTIVKPLGVPTLASVSVNASDASATEGGDTGAFTITRTGATTAALTVNFSVSGTAASGADFVSLGTNATIPAGQSSVIVTVTTINDAEVETTESVVLTLASDAAYNLGSPTTATVNVLDDDAPPLPIVTVADTITTAAEPNTPGQFTISRTGATTSALTVNFTMSGSATAGADYTSLGTSAVIPSGQSNVALAVAPIDDTLVEGTETVTLSIASSATYALGTITTASVNITDNDTSVLPVVTIVANDADAGEPSNNGAWTFTRTGSTASALVVNFNTSGTATRPADYTLPAGMAFTIPAGQASATLALTVVNDALAEATETAICNLAANANYTIGAPASATINITDDDSGGGGLPVITLSTSDSTAAESAGAANNASATITRTGATTNALTVQLSYSGAALNGTDYTALPSSVTIAAGQTFAALTLAPIDDALVEGAETAVISAVADPGYTLGSPAYVSLLINDNDNAAPRTTMGIIFATHPNGAGTASVKLNIHRPATGSGPWPVVIYYPGGGWTTQNEGGISQLFINLTASGYAVVSANYISSTIATWPAQIQDAKAAVRWVRANAATYGFDTTRIGVVGTSSGGHIAAYVGVSGGVKTARIGNQAVDLIGNVSGNLEQSDAVQACAPFYPPTDLLAMDHYPTPDVPDHDATNSPESHLIGAGIQTIPEKTATANPIVLVRAGLPPFWITQGTMDRSVDFNQSELLHAALAGGGASPTFWPVQGAGHGTGVVDSQDVHSLLKAFLDRTFMGAPSNALPLPTFTASTLDGPAPLTVTFDGSASTDPDGVITKYSWSNGDDTGAGTATMTYTYTRPGIYPVTLAVRDDLGGTASVTTNIVVTPAIAGGANPPSITLTAPAEGFLTARPGNLLATVNASAVSGTVASVEYWLNEQPFAWDSKTPYIATLGGLAPGRYRLVARVSDTTGNSTTAPAVNFRVLAPEDAEPIPSIAGGLLSIIYYRFTDGTVSYATERSSDLAGWTAFTPTEFMLQTFPTIEVRKATDPLPIGSDTKRFLRLQIVAP